MADTDGLESDEFLWGDELLVREWQIEDEIELAVDRLIDDGRMGKRAPAIRRELGNALSLLTQIASCQWGCKGGDHLRENLVRRLVNYAFAVMRVTRLGFHNEAVALLRAAGEVANLVELFAIDAKTFAEWSSLSDLDRRKQYGPSRVRKRIAATGNPMIVDDAAYAAMCEFGVHVTPSSADFSHQFDGRVHVGGEFSVTAVLLILNELAILLGACLKVMPHFCGADAEKRKIADAAGDKVTGTATPWVRITNYREKIQREVADAAFDGEEAEDE